MSQREKLIRIFVFTLLCGASKKYYEVLCANFETFLKHHKELWKYKVVLVFFSTKCFETLGPLRVKSDVRIYWQDSTGSYRKIFWWVSKHLRKSFKIDLVRYKHPRWKVIPKKFLQSLIENTLYCKQFVTVFSGYFWNILSSEYSWVAAYVKYIKVWGFLMKSFEIFPGKASFLNSQKIPSKTVNHRELYWNCSS